MNKKGIINDLGQKVILISSLAFLVVIAFLVLGSINVAVQTTPGFGSDGQSFFGDFTARFPLAFDSMIAIMFFGLLIILLGISWLLATNGIVFFLVWIVTVVTMGLAGLLSNAWIDIMATSALSAAVASFPMTNFIMDHYLLFTIVEAFLMITIFFAKQESG